MLFATMVISATAYLTGFMSWQPSPEHLSPLVFLVPALSEEIAFRAWLPGRGDTQRPMVWLVASVTLFTLWHVIEAMTFLPGARLFLELEFLMCAAVLGAACAIMRYRTGSLWPAVLLHGLVVLVWQGFFGGPAFSQLMLSQPMLR